MTGWLPTPLAFLLAAVFEIVGCFAFWAWLRNGAPPWWAALGVASLVLFALALSQVDAAYAGRAFAAYGGVYIAASLAWLWAVESRLPDRWDIAAAKLYDGTKERKSSYGLKVFPANEDDLFQEYVS